MDTNDTQPHTICWNRCNRRNISGMLLDRPPLEERWRFSWGAEVAAVGNTAMSAYARLGRLSKMRFTDRLT